MTTGTIHIESPEPRNVSANSATWKLFFSVLISGFTFFFGLIVLAMMVWPVLYGAVAATEPYFPPLPLSAERVDAFLDSNEVPDKQLYPPLTRIESAGEHQIVIPAIDVQVPIALSPSLNDDDVLETLDHGAALYPNGVAPGRLGNVFIAAHSTGEPWKGTYRFAFLRINELSAGNVLHVDYEGARYTYTVREKEIIVPTSDFRVISDRPVPTMTLMACWPLWSTEKRMLIHADLTNVTQLTSPTISS